MKNDISEYSEQEFFELVKKPFARGCDPDFLDELLYFFNSKLQHPKGSSLVTHPTMVGIEDSPEAVVAELKRWYAEQGLPCFKPE
ncbi:bacteriocin immunity protein [Photobacterium sp. 1_MG-2023]|uniref:bacteriocin immunity protein n=1 Tax=Photobacterium sp. 1_MG-2023 TaxID=3062646 RepID=UPI0026E44241|nr:bacteriocin immunity protein [Photobacterium sp. 1_MG-2023]MDO6709068.1 bacteriocin immunity protein [Photobacterium sp. 1_MG-2023]